MTNNGLPIWIFDGDCGPCEQGSARIREHINPPVDMATYQSLDLDTLGIGEAEVLQGPILVRANGSHVVGPEAMGEMLRLSRAPYRQMGSAMLAPGIRQMLGKVGPRLYQQRWRLPGSTAACKSSAEGHRPS